MRIGRDDSGHTLCLQINGQVTFKLALCRPLSIGIEAPRRALQRDAVPCVAFFYGCHTWPVLHFCEGPAAAFAHFVALAGGANGDAGRVGCGVIPSQPRDHSFYRKTYARRRILAVKHHERIHRCQRPQLWAQRHAIGRGAAFTPIVDGSFDIGDV